MIRTAVLSDLAAIVGIYNQAVVAGFATADLSEVTVDSRREWFVQHEPTRYPIYVFDEEGEIKGWCSLSPYRPGRMALRFTAEISYYVRADARRRGIAGQLIQYAMACCASLGIKNIFAIVLEPNVGSCRLLKKLGFEEWGMLPRVADFDGQECGHLYYGLRISWPKIQPTAAELSRRITLSAVTTLDFDELATIRVAAMRESLERVGRFDPERARERLRKSFYPEQTEFILLDGQRVGFYTFRTAEDGFHLDHFYIHPESQSRGVGSHVLRHLLSRSDAQQLPVYLGALRDSPSNRFYQRHGFVRTAEDEWDIYYIRVPGHNMSAGH